MKWEQALERIKKVGKNFANGFAISAPVGDWAKGAKNVPEDVETVQLLLEYVSRKRGHKEEWRRAHPGRWFGTGNTG